MSDLFTRIRRTPTEIEQAESICATCPVIDNCRELLIEVRPMSGTWAGETGDSNKILRPGGSRHQRRLAPEQPLEEAA
jgi:hypothetical protein